MRSIQKKKKKKFKNKMQEIQKWGGRWGNTSRLAKDIVSGERKCVKDTDTHEKILMKALEELLSPIISIFKGILFRN